MSLNSGPKSPAITYSNESFISIKELIAKCDKNLPLQTWPLNTRKLYKVWYSTDPDVFLPLINQIRFIRMREDNPKAQITFIYSARCLNQNALRKLIIFCEKFSINPVNFDELYTILEDDNDLLFWKYTDTEITHILNNTGGVTAAASDMTRLNSKIASLYGQYSDFDIVVKFGHLPEIIEVKFPLLVPVEYAFNGDQFSGIMFNNEFIGVTHKRDNPDQLSHNARARLNYLQSRIQVNYDRPIIAFEGKIPSDLLECIVVSAYATGNMGTIYAYRTFLEKLSLESYYDILINSIPEFSIFYNSYNTDLDEAFVRFITETDIKYSDPRFYFEPHDLTDLSFDERAIIFFKIIKELAFLDSVIFMAGPNTISNIYYTDLHRMRFDNNAIQDNINVETLLRWGAFYSNLQNNLPKGCIYSDPWPSITMFDHPESSDLSWADEGRSDLQKAEALIISSGKEILTAYRQYKQSEAVYEQMACETATQVALSVLTP
jgi:hypothetical protein